jgi:hypothetical protein
MLGACCLLLIKLYSNGDRSVDHSTYVACVAGHVGDLIQKRVRFAACRLICLDPSFKKKRTCILFLTKFATQVDFH